MAAITANSRSQSERIDDVGLAVHAMDDATRRNAALVDEVAGAGETLREEADGLTRLVGYFRFAAAADAKA